MDKSTEKLRTNSGIKFLLNIRNLKSEDLENDEFVKENKILISENFKFTKDITDDDYKKTISEMDDMIKDILNTKKNLKMLKIQENIKTKEDYLNFFDIRDINGLKYTPEPVIKTEEYYNNLSDIKNSKNKKKNEDYRNIKDIIEQQNDLLKNFEKPENSIIIKENFFPTAVLNVQKNNIFNDKGMGMDSAGGITLLKNKHMQDNYNLTNDEQDFMNKYVYNSNESDDLLDEIDDCIKIGEEIDDYIDYIKK